MICPKCDNAIYIGSRLPEDAYREIGKNEDGHKIFEHYQCPPRLLTKCCARCRNDFYTQDSFQHYCSHYCQFTKDEYDY